MTEFMAMMVLIVALAMFVPFVAFDLGKSSPHGSMIAALASITLGVITSIFVSQALHLPQIDFWAFAATGTNCVTSYFFYKHNARQARTNLVYAPVVPWFGLRHFERLDQEGKGQVRLEDLEQACTWEDLKPEEVDILRHMMAQIVEVGHPFDTGERIVLTNGIHGAAVTNKITFLISRDDLETYEARITKRYGAWKTNRD